MKMNWFKKNKTPEEELKEAEAKRDREEEKLNHLKDRLEIEVQSAGLRIEQELIRIKLKNPDQEYKRRRSENDEKEKTIGQEEKRKENRRR